MKTVMFLLIASFSVSCSRDSKSPCAAGQDFQVQQLSGFRMQGCVGKDSQGNYRRQGEWEFFFPDGTKKAEGAYRDAPLREDGVEEWGGHGMVVSGRTGRWTEWWENGVKRMESTWDNGIYVGTITHFHKSNGTKAVEITIVPGRGPDPSLDKEWDENGKRTK